MILINYLKSTILSKVVMAVTGVILVLFIIGHTIGNLQVFMGREVLNNYAAFLQSLGEILWIIRIVLILSLIFHIITSVRLKFLNLSAKPQKYKIRNYVRAKLTSRTMIWTGIMAFLFLTYHIMHFTLGIVDPTDYGHKDYFEKKVAYYTQSQNLAMPNANEHNAAMYEGKAYTEIPGTKLLFERHDVYYMMIKGFQKWEISAIYIVFVILLGFHLNHAVQSCFQTLGYNHPKYTPKIIKGSTILSTIIVLCLISIPITILLGLVGGSV